MRFKEFLIEGIIKIDESKISDILSVLDSSKNEIMKESNINDIIVKLNDKLSKFNVFFRYTSDKNNLDYYRFGVNGGITYKSGKIVILVNKNITKSFILSKNWIGFKNSVKNILKHEMIHIEQLNKLSGKNNVIDKLRDKSHSDNEQEYLGTHHEMHSMAKEAIEQLRDEGLTTQEILKAIKKPELSDSQVLFDYSRVFSNNKKKLNDFLKLVYLYLQ